VTSLGEITQLLAAARRGEPAVVDRLLPLVYRELHAVAHRQLRHQRPGQTLNTTALVHEAYLKLVDQTRADYQDRGHFLAVAAVAMRHILVDYARRRAAKKRGGDEQQVTLDDARLGIDARAFEILALDQALTSLAHVDERLSKLVELRFFGGLSVEETAVTLGVSERTVKRDWRKARAFLYRALSAPNGKGAPEGDPEA
jgi:RNA polymerase sigma factor (TIGR02999 family)